MVRERRDTRPKRAPARSRKQATAPKKQGSIWETPHLKEILSQPVGAPMELTREEAAAIVRDRLENPRPFDKQKNDRDLRELKKIRRMWGSLVRDVDG